jgi:hypothetical protein
MSRKEEFYDVYEDAETISKMSYEEQLHDYEVNNYFKSYVKYKSPEETEYKDGINYENIEYVKAIAEHLEGKHTSTHSMHCCDLCQIDPEYIIVENIGEYVICGYPELKAMRGYL